LGEDGGSKREKWWEGCREGVVDRRREDENLEIRSL
jgi:hypothetical protein